MSLLKNEYIRTIWNKTQEAPDTTKPGRDFWLYVLSKIFFPGIEYSTTIDAAPVSAQLRRSLGGLDRLNILIEKIGGLSPERVSLVCVVESGAPNLPAHDVEARALDACAHYLETTGFTWLYAMTTLGTSAMLWKYAPQPGRQPELEQLCLTTSYVDADDVEMITLATCLEQMKRNPPA